MTYAPEYYGTTISTSVTVDGRPIIRLTRGDSTAVAISSATDYTGWTATLTIRHRVLDTVLCSVSVAVAAATLTATFSASDTAFATLTTDEDFGPHPFDIQLATGASRQTIKGIAIISRDETRT